MKKNKESINNFTILIFILIDILKLFTFNHKVGNCLTNTYFMILNLNKHNKQVLRYF